MSRLLRSIPLQDVVSGKMVVVFTNNGLSLFLVLPLLIIEINRFSVKWISILGAHFMWARTFSWDWNHYLQNSHFEHICALNRFLFKVFIPWNILLEGFCVDLV